MSEKQLKVGDRAPAFSLLSDSGEKIALKDFSGKQVVLYFYPKDMTPGCTQESCDFRDIHRDFGKQSAVVLGVSRDSVESHQKFKAKYQLNFPLLSDSDGAVCEKYGVWKEKSLYGRKFMGIERTTFVISPEGKIQNIYSKVKVKEHAQSVLESLTSLGQKSSAPKSSILKKPKKEAKLSQKAAPASRKKSPVSRSQGSTRARS